MIEMLTKMLSYPFLARALVAGALLSLCAAMLGVTLVLKRYSMIGDGLSHVAFGTLSVAMALGFAPLAVTVPVVILAAFLLLRLNANSRIRGDAAIALISSSALAIGVIATSLSVGMNIDVLGFLFGSILSVSHGDVILSVLLAVSALVIYLLCYHNLFAVTFDESFARASGTRAGAYHLVIALLTAVTVVVGMRLMGAMLISSLIIFPALTAMRVCRSFRQVTICAAVLSVTCFLIGMFVSYANGTPTGASVVVVNLVAFILFSLVGRLKHAG